MAGSMDVFNTFRAWHGWFNGLAGFEMIVPDVSRAYRRPYEGLSDEARFLTELFNRPRITNTYVIVINNVN